MSKQKKKSGNETTFMEQLFALRVQPKKLNHEMMAKIHKNSEKIDGIGADDGPISREIVAEVKKLQEKLEASREKFDRFNDRIQMETNERPDMHTIREEFYHQQLGLCSDSSNVYSYNSGQFMDLVNEGAVQTRNTNLRGEPLPPKTVYSQTGDAPISGPSALAWNRSVFGFKTTINLPNPGKKYTVDIYSLINVDFRWPDGWLESITKGLFSYGEVTANVYLDAVLDTSSYKDGGHMILHGVTPNRGIGYLGIYNPTNETRTKDMHLRMHVTNPSNSNTLVHVYEMAEFIAERHGNFRRCNAVIWGTCTWSTLVATVIEHC